MNLTGNHLKRVALKLGYIPVEGGKHIRVYDAEGIYITTLPRGKIKKKGTLEGIIKQMGITRDRLNELL